MTVKTRKTPLMLAAFGLGLLALPMAMPSTAQADDFKIQLNLGGAPYYTPVAYNYRPPVQRVVYREYSPQRIVYVSRPAYRERVVYRDYRGNHGKGHGHDRDYGRWNDRGRNVAWR